MTKPRTISLQDTWSELGIGIVASDDIQTLLGIVDLIREAEPSVCQVFQVLGNRLNDADDATVAAFMAETVQKVGLAPWSDHVGRVMVSVDRLYFVEFCRAGSTTMETLYHYNFQSLLCDLAECLDTEAVDEED